MVTLASAPVPAVARRPECLLVRESLLAPGTRRWLMSSGRTAYQLAGRCRKHRVGRPAMVVR